MTILPKHSKKQAGAHGANAKPERPYGQGAGRPSGSVVSHSQGQNQAHGPSDSSSAKIKQRKPSTNLTPSLLSGSSAGGSSSASSPHHPGANAAMSKGLHRGQVLARPGALVHGANHGASSSKATATKQQLSNSQEDGNNSDDEYGAGFKCDELEIRFAERLKKARGFIIKEVKGDGACMFRAVADQIYGDEEMHGDVRHLCMEYIGKNRDHFSQFLTEDFDEYIARKRESDAHGNHVELQAISEIFARPIEIYEYSIGPINTFHPISPEANAGGAENPPVRLSYHGTVHYNSVIDPFAATIGVGLGLPGYKPGLAERNLMREATLASEAQQIEEAMLSDKMKMTDWERTDDELSKQVAKESYMEYLRQVEQVVDAPPQRVPGHRSPPGSSRIGSGLLGSKRGASSPNIPCCSRSTDDHHRPGSMSPVAKMHRDEGYSSSMPNIGASGFGASFGRSQPDAMRPSTSSQSLQATAEAADEAVKPRGGPAASDQPSTSQGDIRPGLYEELLASSSLAYYDDDWSAGSTATALDDSRVLAQIMALSQQEFYESMKKGDGEK